ncbi:unnamed protein product [Adineta steineri]|uniref:ADP ribosyltransferase domain-containing protein n=1 Tax=Adineta steineri TaxID=433720 RepID=A0A815CUD8_9BILA|nr:unnamed protein product [Adineta steineri]CAF1287518.1 unnamed protein product [Adineta steineri]
MTSSRPGSSRIPNKEPNEVTTRVSSANVRKEKQPSVPQKATSNSNMFAYFWLDEDVNKTKDNQEIQKELRKVVNSLQTFENPDECEQEIRKIIEEKIILISSNSMAHQLVPRIHDLSQFKACYIFCQDQPVDKQWITDFAKVKDIFTQQSELIARITEDQRVRVLIEDSGMISIVNCNTESLESRNAMFMWFQLFIEVLFRMHHKINARQELIDVCKEQYQNNSEELSIINEFEKTYKTKNAIWWYTRECCLYRILNKALRNQNFDLLFALRFFITDLSNQLRKEYEHYLRKMPTRDIIRVYRGQAIDLNELKLIQSSIGEFISMNSFLSTSLEYKTALSFLQSIKPNNEIDRILFEIDIDPRQKTVPFCNIDRLSYIASENEVLIMLGALFRIESIHEDKEKKLWIAHITLASEDDFYLKETFAHMKDKIGDETNLHSLGKILTEMGEYKQAQKCYKRMIYESQLDESIGYSGLGWADHWLNQYDESLSNLHKSLSLLNELGLDICEEKGRLHSSIGLVYWRKKLYSEALTNLNTALKIQQATLPSEHPDILATYNRFAITYSAMNEVDLALDYYNKCLNIRLATLPHNHPDIATSYNNIGWLYHEKIGDYVKALDFFQKSLAICRKILPPTHRDIIRTEQNIRKVNEKLQNKSQT